MLVNQRPFVYSNSMHLGKFNLLIRPNSDTTPNINLWLLFDKPFFQRSDPTIK